MKGLGIAMSVLAVVVACGGTPAASAPPPTAATPTVAAQTATAAPTPAVSPTPRPSPLTSAKGNITVTDPLRGDTISSPLTLAGEASVFEATLAWRIVTAGGTVLGQGSTQATAGAPAKGTFKTQISFDVPYYGESGFVEVFERSAKDGSIADIVRVPVGITGSY